MDAKYIAPFIASVENVFTTMLQLPVEIGEPIVSADVKSTYDVSGVIAMSGDVTGSVVLSFPLSAARRVVALFCGSDLSEQSPDFADAIGELVNMVAGGAKAKFDGKIVSINCPSVVVGAKHTINIPSDTPVVRIPFATDCGGFSVDIAIKESASATGGSRVEAA